MKKILWAVDAFQPKNKLQDNCVCALDELAEATGASVEPVYMLSDGLLGLSVSTSSLRKNFKPTAERALNTALKNCGLKNLMPAKVIVKELSSVTDSAKALDRYAKASGADLIVVASHGRKGLSRMLLGSFAETLLLHASVPVIVIGPEFHKGSLKHILFPTDFAPGYKKVFAKVLGLAKGLGARITILNSIPFPVDPVMQSGLFLLGGGWMPVGKDMGMSFENEHKKKAADLVATAKRAGVSANSIVETYSPSASDAVFKIAKKQKAGMIAMAAQSSAVSAALLGSVSRQVIRNSSLPTWILRNH